MDFHTQHRLWGMNSPAYFPVLFFALPLSTTKNFLYLGSDSVEQSKNYSLIHTIIFYSVFFFFNTAFYFSWPPSSYQKTRQSLVFFREEKRTFTSEVERETVKEKALCLF